MPKMGMNIHNINPERNAFLVYGIVPTMETIPKSMAVFEMHVCLSASAIIEKLNTVYTLIIFYKQRIKFSTRLQSQIFNSRCLWVLLNFQKKFMIVA